MCLLGLPGARALDKSPTRVIAPPIIPGPAVAQPRNHTPHLYARSRSDREPYPPSICSPFWVSWPTGILLSDPTGLKAFGWAVCRLLGDEAGVSHTDPRPSQELRVSDVSRYHIGRG